MDSVAIPGTKTKVPIWVVAGVLGLVVVIAVLRGQSATDATQSTQPSDQTVMSEFNRLLQDQQAAYQTYIDQILNQQDGTAPPGSGDITNPPPGPGDTTNPPPVSFPPGGETIPGSGQTPPTVWLPGSGSPLPKPNEAKQAFQAAQAALTSPGGITPQQAAILTPPGQPIGMLALKIRMPPMGGEDLLSINPADISVVSETQNNANRGKLIGIGPKGPQPAMPGAIWARVNQKK